MVAVREAVRWVVWAALVVLGGAAAGFQPEARVGTAEARVESGGGEGEGSGGGGDGHNEDLPRHQVGAALHHEGEVELQRQRRPLWLVKRSHVSTPASSRAVQSESSARLFLTRRSLNGELKSDTDSPRPFLHPPSLSSGRSCF